MPIAAVIFDLFGTLVPKWSGALAHRNNEVMAAELGVSNDAFHRAWGTTFRDRECGHHPTVAAALKHILPDLGISADEARLDAIAQYRHELHIDRIVPRPDVEPTLAALGERGLKLGLLSNVSAPGHEVFRGLPLQRHFESLVFSCEVGFEKPDPAIYARSLEQLGVPARRCLFVGDGGSRELTGAQSAGMQAALIRVDAEIEQEGWLDDAAEWRGPTIGSISEVLDLIDRAGA